MVISDKLQSWAETRIHEGILRARRNKNQSMLVEGTHTIMCKKCTVKKEENSTSPIKTVADSLLLQRLWAGTCSAALLSSCVAS